MILSHGWHFVIIDLFAAAFILTNATSRSV